MKDLHNKEIEIAMLGGILKNKACLFDIMAVIDPQDIYFETNRIIYQKMIELSNNSKEIDIITIGDELSGESGIHSLLADMLVKAEIANPVHYAKKIKEYAVRRWLSGYLSKVMDKIGQGDPVEIISELGSKLAGVYIKTNNENSNVKGIIYNIQNDQAIISELMRNGKKYIGEEMEMPKLDYALSGLRRSFYYIINAYTSTGKTFFALNIANGFINNGKRVVFFSLEMTQEEIVTRLLSIRSGINSISITMGGYMNDERELQAKDDLYKANLEVYSQKRTLDEIKVAMISENLKAPVDLFIIDYIQKIKVPKATSRYERYTEASDELHNLAQKLRIPIIALSQIDNASARSKDTDTISTKGSGDIAADADVIIMLQKDKKRQACYKDGINAVNVIIQKNRHGITGSIEFIMDTRSGKFLSADDYPTISENL
ncbi:MAG: DnaB-like helicase C-terminal domain-containing protein [Candidatus Cloacimonas acidaminovorans]|jgi:replicative DNA helicase|nr:DnaB-like helicase C-terminal domain-containing protein [Candidatus Cloacimonas acidaminovorans]